MVPLPVLSRRSLAYSRRRSTSKPHRFSSLRTLFLSCRSFFDADPLFSITSALFDKNTRGGIPLPGLHESQVTSHKSRPSSCAGAQKPRSSKPAPGFQRLPRPFRGGKSLSDLHGSQVTSHQSRRFVTTFRINTCISVASKRLYLPLESILMKKRGEGEGPASHHSRIGRHSQGSRSPASATSLHSCLLSSSSPRQPIRIQRILPGCSHH